MGDLFILTLLIGCWERDELVYLAISLFLYISSNNISILERDEIFILFII